jgi:hypothetical protein
VRLPRLRGTDHCAGLDAPVCFFFKVATISVNLIFADLVCHFGHRS